MHIDQVIQRAIDRQWCVALNYRHYSRVVIPYALGVGACGGLVLLARQVSGGDHEGRPAGWKLFEVGGIAGSRIVPERLTLVDSPPPELIAGLDIAARSSDQVPSP